MIRQILEIYDSVPHVWFFVAGVLILVIVVAVLYPSISGIIKNFATFDSAKRNEYAQRGFSFAFGALGNLFMFYALIANPYFHTRNQMSGLGEAAVVAVSDHYIDNMGGLVVGGGFILVLLLSSFIAKKYLTYYFLLSVVYFLVSIFLLWRF